MNHLSQIDLALGKGAATVIRVVRNAEDSEGGAEKKFLLNLKRMMGRTDAVTPECFLEFLVFLNNDGIEELQFIEEAYTSVMFNDATLNVAVCSVEVNLFRC